MAKFFITIMLLAFVALENNCIFNRLHAKSQANFEKDTVVQLLRHKQHLQQQQHNKLQQQYHTLNNHQPRKQQIQYSREQTLDAVNEYNYDPNKSEDAMILAQHVARHKRHKQQQIQQHDALLNQRKRGERQQLLRTMPRIWQHLLDTSSSEEYMFSDQPYESQEQQQEEPKDDYENADEVPTNHLDDDELPSAEHDEQSNERNSEQPKSHSGCPKCDSHRTVEHLSEEELTALRIEFVKQQILDKLRLKERPKVSAIGLPKPIYEVTTIDQEHDEPTKSKEVDDYYARTSKKFIFLEREVNECKQLNPSNPSVCFSFKINDADADSYDVNTAVLWIFKNKQKKLKNDTIQTIVVTEVQQQQQANDYIPITKTIAIQSINVEDEWMKINIEWPIKRWFGNHELSHLIQITCQSCDISSMDEMISLDKDYRPFIMIDTQNRKRQARQKRNINCTGNMTECCREKLYINFADIGWGDWIIQPRGYDAYFCRGSCTTFASIPQSLSHHTTFSQRMLKYNPPKNITLTPCCTAKQYSSLQLLILGDNNTAIQKTFPNMVIESCGCR